MAGVEPRTWLVTGASRGLGRALVSAVLGVGDRVAATVRAAGALQDLKDSYGTALIEMVLDIRDRSALVSAVNGVVDRWKSVDVCVNNAGYGLAGAIEEVTEEQARRQLDVNFFGALWVTQAVLPHMRRRRAGHIVQISSIAAVRALPYTGLYCASKWALEGMSESLAQEGAAFGIKVTIVEPGPFRTDWSGTSMERAAPMPEYKEVLAHRRHQLSGASAGSRPGDPACAAQAVLKIVDAPRPPLRIVLGNIAADAAPLALARRLEELGTWEALARSCDFAEAPKWQQA